jgi:hypothetical protein
MESLLNRLEDRVNGNNINMGTVNGWTKECSSLYRELSSLFIEGTRNEKNLGRCYNEYSFSVMIEENMYHVVYKVDSGD